MNITKTKPNRDDAAALSGAPNEKTGDVSQAYHDFYDGEKSYEESFEEYFDAEYTAKMFELVWGRKPPYSLLDCGSASGLTLGRFYDLGIEPWGIEYSAYMVAKTKARWKDRNVLGDVTAMPFADDQFDFLYDTSLCYVPPERVEKAISEMARVCKTGIFFGAIVEDNSPEQIEEHDLFYGVKTLATLEQWSEKFLRNGWRLEVTDPKVMEAIWQCECDANEDDYPWYRSKEAMRYCFYTKVRR
jgi:SAM-dependent methyltransferase